MIQLSIDLTADTYAETVISEDTRITASMAIINSSVPSSAMGDDWTFTTADGSLALTGTVSEQTTITLILGVVA